MRKRWIALAAVTAIWVAVAFGIAQRQGAWHVIAQQPAPCVSNAPAYVGAGENGEIGLIGADCVLRWWKR